MDRGGLPEVVEERSLILTNGARADDEAPAPDAQQKREMWVVEIKNRLKRFANTTKPPSRSSTDQKKNNEIDPSIFWTGKPPKKFYIGCRLRRNLGRGSDPGHSDVMWEYVAFMSEWLGLDVNRWLELMEEKEGDVRAYYDEDYGLVTESKHFLETLLVTSCFLCFSIVLFQNGKDILKGTLENDNRSQQFSGLCEKIMDDQDRTKLDMLNQNNQIPWFVVEAVFTNSNLSELIDDVGTSYWLLILRGFNNFHPKAVPDKVDGGGTLPKCGFKHLLHIFHWSRTPDEGECNYGMDTPTDGSSLDAYVWFHIPTVTELLRSATVIEKLDNSRGCNLQYRTRMISPLLKITPLHIYPYSKELYSNLVTFEQKWWDGNVLDITVHLACLKCLLQTKDDVKILQKNGIVINTFAEEKDVLSFVHDMGRLLADEPDACIPSKLVELSEKVKEHHHGRIGKEYSKFKRLYFPNRWVLVSILAGVTLGLLTIVQTVYTVLSYYKG